MDYLPLFHRLQGKPCLVVGGGQVALRKVRTLAAAGAQLKVVAPDICAPLRVLAAEIQDRMTLLQRDYHDSDLDGLALVVVATDLGALNTAISNAAQARQIPVNVVDQPELCSVVFPAIVDRSPVLVAISTGASSPTLGRLLRSRIESLLPGGLGRLAEFARRFRGPVKSALPDITARTRFWESILEGRVSEQIYSGNEAAAAQELLQSLGRAGTEAEQGGEVYLVGAGPGDPDLLTFKALRLMQRADVVLYDRLVSEPVLDLVRRDAERIYVGKRAGDHAVPQHDINQLLVDLALQGRRVLRLKGGDPFIFGRGGEEIERLAEFGVPFQVVPGITAASGSASYAGIPLTHRDYSQSVHFVTGHQQADGRQPDWSKLAAENQTLVFYMSLTNLASICTRLIKHGRPATTPVALIEKATTPDQRVLVSDLNTLPGAVQNNRLRAPTLLIVGEVVQLREKLAWYRRDAVIVEDSDNE